MHERVDEWLASSLTEFEGKPFKSVTRGELDLGSLEDEAEKKQQEESAKAFDDLLKQMKESLGETVKEVRVTHRLTNSPACLVTGEHEMSANLERILKSVGQQALRAASRPARKAVESPASSAPLRPAAVTPA